MATRHYVGVAECGAEACWISFPAFPGVTSGGDTLPELLQNAPEALALAVEAMQEDGTPLPPAIETDPAALNFDHNDYSDPIVTVVPVEVVAGASRIDVTTDGILLACLDDLGARLHTSRSALLAQGAQLLLASGASDAV